jgi:hypothetical protein
LHDLPPRLLVAWGPADHVSEVLVLLVANVLCQSATQVFGPREFASLLISRGLDGPEDQCFKLAQVRVLDGEIDAETVP